MRYRQRLLGVAVVALGAAFALPSHAATKQFSISVNTTSTTTTLTYTNGTQGGGSNSTINSVWFIPPFAVSNVTLQPSLVTSNTTVSPASCATAAGCPAKTKISITFINGIPTNGGAGAVTMTGSPPNAATSCTSAFNWSAQAYTGNALGGVNFTAPNGTFTATATTNVSCVLQFVNQPANTTVGANIVGTDSKPLQVEALVNGSVASWFGNNSETVTLTSSSGSLLGGGPVTASAGFATFGNPPTATALTLSPAGTYSLTAMATGFTNAVSNQFKIFDGLLDCGEPFASNFVNPGNIAPDQPGYAAGGRNAYNKDGVSAECVPVLYTFENDILTSNLVHLSWDTVSQPNAAFSYSMNWQPQLVVTSNPGNVQPSPIGWPVAPRPGVAWLNVDGSTTSIPGTPAFIPGLACLSDKLPAPYGTLGSDVQVNGPDTVTIKGIAANPTVNIPGSMPPANVAVPSPGWPAVPTPPFPIVIANTDANGNQTTATERMTATSINGSISPPPSSGYTGTYTITYNVTRNTATEGFSARAFHAAQVTTPGPNNGNDPNTYVMSTPLPIIPNDTTTFPAPYHVQRQAQMCIAAQGFTAFTNVESHMPMSDFPNNVNLNAQVLYSTTVIDIGDGYVKGSF
ncbi:MAG TPA: hypothetical protein VJ891_09555 [Casimicrobiaceae bacterium]|nr:hypothetical protein [Casimicrobiaceae bacterium]